MKRYLYTNQKGGVAKTTDTYMYSVAATLSGKRVLVIDNDPQGNLTYAFGYTAESLHHTTYTLMMEKSTIEETILPTYYDPKSGRFFDPNNPQLLSRLGLSSLSQALRGPDLLPNNTNLSIRAERELQDHPSWGLTIRQFLEELEDQYDEVHIDTSPSITSLITKAAYYAATDVVIPLVPENFPVQGMIVLAGQLMEARLHNKKMNLAGIIIARVKYASHRELIDLTREQIVPQINVMFANTQREEPRYRQALEGFHLVCFDTMMSEGADYGRATNRRANLLLTNDGINPFGLEYWLSYIELLKNTNGTGLVEATQVYNQLARKYTAQQETEEANRQARAVQNHHKGRV